MLPTMLKSPTVERLSACTRQPGSAVIRRPGALHWSALVTVGLLWGCAPPALDPSDTGAAQPSIEIRFPSSSETLHYCSTMIVVVDVLGFQLEPDALGDDAEAGHGHWHLLDGGVYVDSTGDPWTAVQGDLALADGRHFLTAELVNNDHQPLEPAVTSNLVEFDVVEEVDCVGGTTSDAADVAATAAAAAAAAVLAR